VYNKLPKNLEHNIDNSNFQRRFTVCYVGSISFYAPESVVTRDMFK